jgi:hypothetical protein
MCAMVGADVGQLRSTATQITSAGRALVVLERELSARLNGTAWVGQDGDRFRSDWSGTHRRSITCAAEALIAAAEALVQQAAEQEGASAAGSGAPGSGGSFGAPTLGGGGDAGWTTVPPPNGGDPGAAIPGLGLSWPKLPIPDWVKDVVGFPMKDYDDLDWVKKNLPTVTKVMSHAAMGPLGFGLDLLDSDSKLRESFGHAWDHEWMHAAGDLSLYAGEELKHDAITGMVGGTALSLIGFPEIGIPLILESRLPYAASLPLQGVGHLLHDDVLKNFDWPSWSDLGKNALPEGLNTVRDVRNWMTW